MRVSRRVFNKLSARGKGIKAPGPLHSIALQSHLIAGCSIIRQYVIDDSRTLYSAWRSVIESRRDATGRYHGWPKNDLVKWC
jgi:hypothetical protein